MADATTKSGPGPLAGIRIIDMTTVVMGPYATQLLADYGADVIKVEPPSGDIMRHAPPMRNPRMGALFLQANRNKRSVVLDVKKQGGREALLRLCATADVFIHNVRKAAMQRAGLGEADVRAGNPKLVYVSLIGYSEGGPYAGRPAYDDLMQGLSGIPALQAEISGEQPRYMPLTFVDRIMGVSAVHAVLAAIVHRDRSGAGQAVDVPMFETVAQLVLGDHMGGRTFEPPLGKPGYGRLLAPDRRPYRTKDGHVCVLIYNNKEWETFFRAIGQRERFEADPRLSDHAVRTKHYSEVYAILAEIFTTRTSAEWLTLLAEHDIPGVPLYSLDDLIDDPHLQAVGFFQAMEHPSEGPIRLTGIPSHWSETPPAITRHAPLLGEHSIEVLREAGLQQREIDTLIEEGVTIDGRMKGK
ncbi:MAG: CoA transferase [Bradyrhizobiaceae bacterium]|nr:CoA transferase [Bradyrhizobiaceae bacterium]